LGCCRRRRRSGGSFVVIVGGRRRSPTPSLPSRWRRQRPASGVLCGYLFRRGGGESILGCFLGSHKSLTLYLGINRYPRNNFFQQLVLHRIPPPPAAAAAGKRRPPAPGQTSTSTLSAGDIKGVLKVSYTRKNSELRQKEHNNKGEFPRRSKYISRRIFFAPNSGVESPDADDDLLASMR